MKTKVLILTGLLIIAFAAMVAPVMAAASSSGGSNITANPSPYLSLTAAGNITYFQLAVGANSFGGATGGDLPGYMSNLTLTSNSNYTVTATDALDQSKPAATAGKLSEYDTVHGTYNTSAYYYLSNALHTVVTTNMTSQAGYVTGFDVTLDDTQQSLATGGNVSGGAIPVAFTQQVTTGDLRLPTNLFYRIVVTFTGTAI